MNKNNNKGCVSGILGTLAVILGVIVYAVLSSLLCGVFVGARFPEKPVCALLTFLIPSIGIAFVIFEVIFVAWQIKLSKKGGDGEKKFKRIFKIVTLSCISALLLLSVVGANTYTKLDDSTISKVCFIDYKSYDIDEDISRCTLSCSADGALSYTVTMKDGEKIEFFNSVNAFAGGFKEKYENLFGYASYISEKLSNDGLPTRIVGEKYMEKYYKEDHAEVWKYLEAMIRTVE
ncbi:MAG: hypothetical protein ACI3X1_01770 [Eubacteriales bacterium]